MVVSVQVNAKFPEGFNTLPAINEYLMVCNADIMMKSIINCINTQNKTMTRSVHSPLPVPHFYPIRC